jgi:hypothetical protein
LTQQQVPNANLTAQGYVDWAVWGEGSTSLSPTDRKLGGTAISNLTPYSNGSLLRAMAPFGHYGESTFAWTNGTPTPDASDATSGIQLDAEYGPGSQAAVGEGFSFTVAAGPSARQLILYSTVHQGTASLAASLSDSSAPALVQNLVGSGPNVPFVSTILFAADSPGQLLTVTLKLTHDGSNLGNSNAAIQGAAVSLATPVPAITPAVAVVLAILLCGIGVLLLGGSRRVAAR